MNVLNMGKENQQRSKKSTVSFHSLSSRKMQKDVKKKLENGERVFLFDSEKTLFELTLADF